MMHEPLFSDPRLSEKPAWTFEEESRVVLASVTEDYIPAQAMAYARGYNEATEGPLAAYAVHHTDGEKRFVVR